MAPKLTDNGFLIGYLNILYFFHSATLKVVYLHIYNFRIFDDLVGIVDFSGLFSGLFVEANVYNANLNMLLIVTILHEINPTGGWNMWQNIQALKLYRYLHWILKMCFINQVLINRSLFLV